MLKQPRPKTSSAEAHTMLRKIYDERIGDRMSQAHFAKLYDIGSPCILTQYLNGSKPLGVEAAARFAKALGCTIEDFAPDLAERFTAEVMPFLGKKLRRAAMLALSIPALSSLAPRDAQASEALADPVYYVKSLLRLLLRSTLLRSMCADARMKVEDRQVVREVRRPALLFLGHGS